MCLASLCAVPAIVLPVVGGPSAGRFEDGTAGWSFEFTVKPGMQEEWAKVMDLGSTRNASDPLQCNSDIVFGCPHSAHTAHSAAASPCPTLERVRTC